MARTVSCANFMLLLSCPGANDTCGPQDQALLQNLQAKEEATSIALYLSGELIAPESFVRNGLEELHALREAFGLKYPLVADIRFCPPWTPGTLCVILLPDAAADLATGKYHAWDELNERYALVSTKSVTETTFLLQFNEPLHPSRLGEAYAGLPGIEWAAPGQVEGCTFSNLYPGTVAGHNVYLFNESRSEGADNRYLYFSTESGQARLVGDWSIVTTCFGQAYGPCNDDCVAGCQANGLVDCPEYCRFRWLENCQSDCPGAGAIPGWWWEAYGVMREYWMG